MTMQYSSDGPIICPEEDLYQRNEFAEGLAGALAALNKDECYVIGLFSPWGYGKTSCVNLLERSLENNPLTQYIYIDAWASNGDISNIQYEMIAGLSELLGKESKKDKKTSRLNSLFRKLPSRKK